MSNQSTLPVTAMFEELIRLGHITPTVHMEELREPGALNPVPTRLGYVTPDVPIRLGVHADKMMGS